MGTAVQEIKETPATPNGLPFEPLDEAVWQAWIAKSLAREQKGTEVRLKAVKALSIVALLAIAGFWSHLGPFDAVLRFTVTAAASVAMSRGVSDRNFTSLTVFGILALIYNPIFPVLAFSGSWQRGFVILSAIPFLVSLGRSPKDPPNGIEGSPPIAASTP